MMSPLIQHHHGLPARILVGVRALPTCEVAKISVTVVVRQIGRVTVFVIPDPAVELIHPGRTVLDGGRRVPFCFLGILAEGQQPVKTPFPLAAVVEVLSFVE